MYSLSLEWKPRSFALSLLLNKDRILSSLSGSFKGSSSDGVVHKELLEFDRSEKKPPNRMFYKIPKEFECASLKGHFKMANGVSKTT